jgi:hypothetical protein
MYVYIGAVDREPSKEVLERQQHRPEKVPRAQLLFRRLAVCCLLVGGAAFSNPHLGQQSKD